MYCLNHPPKNQNDTQIWKICLVVSNILIYGLYWVPRNQFLIKIEEDRIMDIPPLEYIFEMEEIKYVGTYVLASSSHL